MSFTDVLFECIGNKKLISEFNRLTGFHMGERSAPLQSAIDDACGYDPDKEAFPEFVAFVHECIWQPLVSTNGV